MRAFSVSRVSSGGTVAFLVLAGIALLSAASAEAACTALTCPDNIAVATRNSFGVVVTYPPPTTTGTCTVEQAQGLPSGDTFPLGETMVSFRDKDDAGVHCSFTVTVKRLGPAPALGEFALGALAAALAGFGVWTVRRRSR
jgi:hypothetical protein